MGKEKYFIVDCNEGNIIKYNNQIVVFDTSEEIQELVKHPLLLFGIEYKIEKALINENSFAFVNYINWKELHQKLQKSSDVKNKTLQEVLDTNLSAENVKNMPFVDLSYFLISNNIVNSVADIQMLIVEGIQRALKEDDEFPIRYYAAEEEMSEDSKVVKNPGEMLTDELVSKM